MISPKKVMRNVEKKKAIIPAMTELDNKVSNTLMPTFPQSMVVKRKLEFCLSLATLMACGFCFCDSISRRSLEILKKARLRPENMADCDMQKMIPSQISVECMALSLGMILRCKI